MIDSVRLRGTGVVQECVRTRSTRSKTTNSVLSLLVIMFILSNIEGSEHPASNCITELVSLLLLISSSTFTATVTGVYRGLKSPFFLI